MAKQDFTVEFEFTSEKADGLSYTRREVIRANTPREAENIARIVGGSLFGARFTDNCTDWRVVA